MDSQLQFLCRRGLKELDMIFEAYLKNHANKASKEEIDLLIKLLEMDDQSLLMFIIKEHQNGLEKVLCDKLKDAHT